MNNLHKPKITRRNISSSNFSTNIFPGYTQNQNLNIAFDNIQQINPNYVNQSLYPGDPLNENEINELNELNECPHCISYQQKINENQLIIQKLQNQLSRYKSSISNNSSNLLPNMELNDINLQNNNQIYNLKKLVSELRNEISKKNGENSQIRLNYDELANNFISEKNQLENEIVKLKKQNLMLNKANIKFKKMLDFKDEEIYKKSESIIKYNN